MLAWLALLIAQPTLVTRDNLARHRQLGRIGGLLAIFITGLGIFTGIAPLVLNRFPPFFTPPHFLALTVTDSLVFGAMVAWAIRRRRATDWHRRLMLGATIVILSPALGRMLPIPLLGQWAEPAVTLCQRPACPDVHDLEQR